VGNPIKIHQYLTLKRTVKNARFTLVPTLGVGMHIHLKKHSHAQRGNEGKHGKSRYLRIDYHDGVSKSYGSSGKVLHPHWGKTGNQMKKHRRWSDI